MGRDELGMSEEYAELLAEVKRTVATTRWRAQRVVNTELVAMYWQIGKNILRRQEQQEWGRAVVERLSDDLRRAFPQSTGLSQSNLFYMRSFAAAWPQF